MIAFGGGRGLSFCKQGKGKNIRKSIIVSHSIHEKRKMMIISNSIVVFELLSLKSATVGNRRVINVSKLE